MSGTNAVDGSTGDPSNDADDNFNDDDTKPLIEMEGTGRKGGAKRKLRDLVIDVKSKR